MVINAFKNKIFSLSTEDSFENEDEDEDEFYTPRELSNFENEEKIKYQQICLN